MQVRYIGMHEAVEVPVLVFSAPREKDGKHERVRIIEKGVVVTIRRHRDPVGDDVFRQAIRGLLIQDANWEAMDAEAAAVVKELADEAIAAEDAETLGLELFDDEEPEVFEDLSEEPDHAR